MHELAFVFAGFAVGLIVGLTGVGGGSLMTPVLIFFFGIKPHLAIGTDLLFAAFTKMGGTVSLARQRLVPWRVVAQLCAGSIPAALLALWTLKALGPASGQAQRIMTTTLGFALLLTAAATLYKVVAFSRERQAADHAKRLAGAGHAARPRHWALPVLLLVYPLLPLPRVIGADIAYAVPLTLVAGLGHASLGSVDWALLAQLLAGSLPGIWLGSRLVTRTPERLIRSALSVLLAWAGLKLVLI